MFVCLFVGKANLHAANAFSSSGTGTKSDPYIVNTADQFKKLADLDSSYESKWFKLGADIDLNNQVIQPIAHVRNLYGDGHVIKNLKINSYWINGDYTYSGVFAFLYNVSNLGVQNAVLEITPSNTKQNIFGILTAQINGSGSTCFVKDSIIKINSPVNCTMHYGPFMGWQSNKTTQLCYAINCTIDLSNYDGNVSNGGVFAGIVAGKGYVKCCFANTKVIYKPGSTERINCFINSKRFDTVAYDKDVLGYEFSQDGVGSYNTSQMIGKNSAVLINNSVFRVTESYPVLRAFDTKINSLNLVSTHSKLSNPLKVTLDLSNTLNQQGQNDKICLYVDDEVTPLAEITSGNEINIPANKLIGLSVGQHSLKARVFDCFGNALGNWSQTLTLNVKEPPAPTITGLVISPSKISKSKTTELKLTVLGENLSSKYDISLKYTNKNDNSATLIYCGALQNSGSLPQVINITGDALSSIKSLPIGDYIVEPVITKVGEQSDEVEYSFESLLQN